MQRGLHRARRAQTLRGGFVRVRHGYEKIERRRPLVVIRGGIRAGHGHGRLTRALCRELIDAERRQPGEEAKRLRLQVPQLLPRPPRPGALHARRRSRQRLHKGQQAGHELTPRERHPGLVVRERRQQLPREALHLEVLRGCRVCERVDHAVFESVQASRRRGTQLWVHGDVSRDLPQTGDPQRRAGASVLGEHARGDEQVVPELLVRFPVPLAERRRDELAESGAETLGSRPGRGFQRSPGGVSHALQHVPHQLGRVEHDRRAKVRSQQRRQAREQPTLCQRPRVIRRVARLQEHPHHRQLQLIVAHAVRGGEAREHQRDAPAPAEELLVPGKLPRRRRLDDGAQTRERGSGSRVRFRDVPRIRGFPAAVEMRRDRVQRARSLAVRRGEQPERLRREQPDRGGHVLGR